MSRKDLSNDALRAGLAKIDLSANFSQSTFPPSVRYEADQRACPDFRTIKPNDPRLMHNRQAKNNESHSMRLTLDTDPDRFPVPPPRTGPNAIGQPISTNVTGYGRIGAIPPRGQWSAWCEKCSRVEFAMAPVMGRRPVAPQEHMSRKAKDVCLWMMFIAMGIAGLVAVILIAVLWKED